MQATCVGVFLNFILASIQCKCLKEFDIMQF